MAGEQRIQLVNAIAVARGSQEPSNLDIFWVDENITGAWYEKLKAFNSNNNSWELVNRTPEEILDAIKTVDGAGSGLDADTLQGYTPAQLIRAGGGGGSVPALSTGQVLVGQADTIGTAQSVGGIATIQADGTLVYVNGSISHTGLSNIGTNTHAEIDAHISDNSNPHSVTASQVGNTVAQWNANQLQGSTLNIGTPGVGEDAFAVTWDNTAGEFVLAEGGSNISNANLSWSGGNTSQNLSGNELAFTGGLNKFEKVELTATDRGLLINRVTTAQMNLISSPTTNEIVYNTDLNGLYRYDGAAWVGLSAGYGIIEVVRDSDNGVPTYFSDLQTALETCKSSGSNNVIKLHSDISLSAQIDINYGGTGVGNAYQFHTLTIDFNGFKVTFDDAGSTDVFNISFPNGATSQQKIHFINGEVYRLNGTGTHYALHLPSSGRGNVMMSKMYWYCQNGGAYRVANTSPIGGFLTHDLGGSKFVSEGSNSTVDLGFSPHTNFNCENTSTGVALGDNGASYISNFYAKANSGVGYFCRAVIATRFEAQSNSGRGLELDNDSRLKQCSHFVAKSDSDYAIYAQSNGDTLSHFEAYGNSNTYACWFVSGVLAEHGKILSNSGYGAYIISSTINNCSFTSISGNAGAGFRENNKISNCTFNGDGGYGADITNFGGNNNSVFKNCTFTSSLNTTSGHAVNLDLGGGDVTIVNSSFEVVNSGANCLFASSAESSNVINSSFIGATTPINANVTITASTDLGNGNTQI